MALQFKSQSEKNNKQHQNGVVLVIVLIVVAVISLASTSVLQSTRLNLERVSRIQDVIQARELLNMGREWSALIIFQDMLDGPKNNRDFDNFEDDWAQDLGSPIEGEAQQAEMKITITDAQSRFNLNNLHPDVDNEDQDWFKAYVVLLQSLVTADSEASPEVLAHALRDWIDSDVDVGDVGGAEDQEYFRKETPYRAANRPLTNLGELLLIEGYTPELVESLRDYVVALPIISNEATKININTASETVFTTLMRGGFKDDEITDIFDRLPEPVSNEEEAENEQEQVGGLPPIEQIPEDSQTPPGEESSEQAQTLGQEHENASGARFEAQADQLKSFVQALNPDDEGKLNDLLEEHYDVKTDYFIVTIQVKIDEVELKERIVMSRYANKQKGAINLSVTTGNTRRDIIKYVQTNRIL